MKKPMELLEKLLGERDPKSRLAKLADREIELTDEIATLRQRLMEAREAATERYLISRKFDDVDVERMERRIFIVQGAIAGLRAARSEAIVAERDAEVRSMRQAVEIWRSQAAEIEDACLKPLKELAELQDVPFTLAVLSEQMKHHAAKYVPKSNQLRQKALLTETHADELARAVIAAAGTVDLDGQTDASTFERAVLTHRSESPTLATIRDWEDRCSRATHFALCAGAPRRYLLTWRGGEIDESSSFLYSYDAARLPDGSFDVARATWRPTRATA